MWLTIAVKIEQHFPIYEREYHVNFLKILFNEAIYFKNYLLLKTKRHIHMLMEKEVSEIMKFIIMAIFWGE